MRITITLFLLIPMLAMGQQRGFKSVSINVEGQNIELYKQSHALVIGISKYSNGWPSLPGVKTDVDDVKNALEANDFNVVVARDLNKADMDKAFSDFIAKYGQDANNRLVFYFAGHGHTVKTSYGDKLGYIVPSDAPNPNSNATEFQLKSMEMAQIEIYAKRIQSKHALFLFDACFSGSIFAITRAVPEVINYKTKEPVRQFIASGNEDETVPDKSIFKSQFVNAITTDNADSNKDGYLTGTELGEFLQTSVINYSRSAQHPQYGKIRHPALDKGDFVFPLAKVLASAQATTTSTTTTTSQPQIGTIATIIELGSVELTSEITGDLFLDGNKLASVQANTIIPINKIASGSHTLEVRGTSDTWQGNVYVMKDQTARITATRSNKPTIGVTGTASGAVAAFTVDSRDGTTYKTISLGNQIWLADNMYYGQMSDTWCYDNKKECKERGRLYTWQMAQAACPAGWRLPTRDEVDALVKSLGADEKKAYKELKKIAPSFITITGIRTEKKAFTGNGTYSSFWTSTPGSDGLGWAFTTHGRFNSIKLSEENINGGLSVKCIKD